MNKIKEIRKSQNLTLGKLAQMSGISTGYLSHLERGTRKNPTKIVMQKISEALNKSINEIFFDE